MELNYRWLSLHLASPSNTSLLQRAIDFMSTGQEQQNVRQTQHPIDSGTGQWSYSLFDLAEEPLPESGLCSHRPSRAETLLI